jgi:hypothetical protein
MKILKMEVVEDAWNATTHMTNIPHGMKKKMPSSNIKCSEHTAPLPVHW